MKYFFVLYLFIGAFAYAEFEEITCDFSSLDGTYIEYDNFKLAIKPTRTGECEFQISTKEAGGGRGYIFSEEGKMHITTSFEELVAENLKGTLSQTTGTKGYFFYPAVRNLRALRDNETGAIKFEMVNGGDIYIDASTGLIDESKTQDFVVKQDPIKLHSASISMTPTKYPILTFGYRSGNTNETDRSYSVLLENNGKNCRIPAKKLFDYKVACGQIPSCSCDPDIDPVIAQLKNCAADVSEIGTVSTGLLNGVLFKDSSPKGMNSIVSQTCPDFFTEEQINQQVSITTRVLPDNFEQIASQRNYSRQETGVVTDGNAPVVRGARGLSPRQSSASESTGNEGPVAADSESDNGDGEETEESGEELAENCHELLGQFFKDEENQEKIQKYLKTQAQITLHRIAWTALKKSANDTRKTEKVIQDALKERDPQLHQQFIENAQLSINEKLLKAMQALKEVSDEFEDNSKNDPYTIKYSDVKMTQLLVDAEKELGNEYKTGVMKFLPIIENSLKVSDFDKKQNIDFIEDQMDVMLGNAKKLEDKLQSYLEEENCLQNQQLFSCHSEPEGKIDIKEVLNSSEEILDKLYQEEFGKKDEIKNNLKWNSFWLYVK